MALASPLSLQIPLHYHIINREIPHKLSSGGNFRSPKLKPKAKPIITIASLQRTSTQYPISEITTIQSQVFHSQHKDVQLKEALSVLDTANQQIIPLKDSQTYASLLQACTDMKALEQAIGGLQKGKGIHGYVIRIGLEWNVVLEDALVDMYAKCGDIRDSQQVFDKMPQRDVVSYNVMIAGYAYNGLSDEALDVFSEMRLARVRPNLRSWNTLIEVYSNVGNCDEAFNLLKQMKLSGVVPNVVSWNTVISGYARNGHNHEALRLFRQMVIAEEKPSVNTIVIVLSVCPYLEDPQHGKDMHGYIIRNGFLSDSFVGNALVDMYAKMGCMEDAHQVFEELFDGDEVLRNSVIADFTLNGHAD